MATVSGIAALPEVFGACLNVAEITDLATLAVDGMTVGTTAYVRADDSYWQMKVSSDVVDHSTVEAVSGYDDMRWLFFNPSSSSITSLTGDVTATGPGAAAATVVNLPTGVTMAGQVLATAIVAPATPAAGKGAVYVDSTSKNLAVKDDAGVVKHGVQTNSGSANNFLTAISDAGVVSNAQPSSSNLSDITATGSALVTAVSAAAARGSLGSTTVGDAVFIAATASAARTATGLDGLAPNAGAALTNADSTIAPGTDKASIYTLPAATLNANHTVTLGVTGSPTTGLFVRVVRRDRTGNTFAVINGGTNGGTLFTFPATPTVDSCVDVFYNGVDWILVAFTWLSGTA